ncbi:MAG: hypothetical protein M3O20_09070 [Acidobacteriota bacterium]|nr:hypothetical protein [Acidobacteriota bacterium]
MGSATAITAPPVQERAHVLKNRLTPSLCDLFFLAVIAWSFMTSGTGWSRLLWDGDTAIHIATGNWILDHGKIPTTDPFSFTQPGVPWIPYEWGTEVLFAQLNHALGLKGIVFVCGVGIAALIVVLLRTMLAAGADVLLSIVTALFASNALLIHYHARPHLFTLLFLAIAAYILTQDRIRHTRMICLLPALTAVWVNLHPGFIILFAYLGAFVIGSVLEGSRASAKRYALLTAACAAATLLNPFGYKLHLDVFTYLHGNGTTEFIQEFQAPTFRSQPQLFYMGFLITGVALCGLYLSRRKFVEPLLLIGTAYASLTAVRHSTIFVVLAAPMIAAELSRHWQAWVARQPRASAARILDGLSSEKRAAFSRSSIWLPAGLAAIFFCTPQELWPIGFDKEMFPVDLAARHPELATSRLFTSDQWADYLLYANYPRQKVFYDDRAFYGVKMYRDATALLTAQPASLATLDRYQIDRVLMPTHSPLSQLLHQSTAWQVIDHDTTAELFSLSPARPARP